VDLASLKQEARSKHTTASRLLELSRMDLQLSRVIAKAKHTPPSVLEALARSGDATTVRAVASNPNASPPTLEFLSKHGQWSVLKALADNPSVSEAIMQQLAVHPRDTVRQALSNRAQLSSSVALTLVRDPDEIVRCQVVNWSWKYNWNTDAMFEITSLDDGVLVRTKTAERCGVTTILERLLSDSEWRVRRTALANPRLPLPTLLAHLPEAFPKLQTEESWSITSSIAHRADLTEAWLERFASHPNATVRSAVVSNPGTPEKVVLELLEDKDWGVLNTAARACVLPLETYWRFAGHENVNVRLGLVQNKNLPRDILEFLTRDADDYIAGLAREKLA
jgi:hypothetical protein